MTHEQFTATVLEAERPVLVDFTAAWCPPCRVMQPVLAAIDAERDDLDVVEVDVDDSIDVAAAYGVLSMPTFMLFDHGAPVLTLIGARPRKRLEAELDDALAERGAQVRV
jgi:thioredoxin 1